MSACFGDLRSRPASTWRVLTEGGNLTSSVIGDRADVGTWLRREPGEIQDFLRRPRPTGDRRWDTLIAASVAWACRRRGISAPKWTRRTPLESWWFPADGGGLLAARTMARTPIDFSRLGIWLDAAAFQTA